MHDFPGRKPTWSLIRCCSSRGVTLFRIIRSYNLYVWHKRDIGLYLFGIAESFHGFNMAIIFHCLQSFGILFYVRHLLSIVCNRLWALGPRFFSCSTSTSYMPAALLYLSAAIPFLYSSSLNADTTEGIPSTVGSTGRFGFVGIVPRPLTSSRCATWFALTRHGGFVEVGLLDNFIYHALRLLWVRSVDVMTSSHFFLFCSFFVSIYFALVSSVPSPKGLLEYCLL